VAGEFGSGVWTQPVEALHVSTVHSLTSAQAELTGVNTQPVAVLHVSVVHAMLSLHVMVFPEQTPLKQTSLAVHALPSLHGSVLGT
jgi:hypothetical protein